MGYRLARQAQGPQWSALSDAAYRVLVLMAWHCLDAPHNDYPAGVYWGGRVALAALRFNVEEPTPAQVQKIKRAMTELVRRGAITCTTPAVGGRSAHYTLTLDGEDT